MNGTIARNTEVVSVSLRPATVQLLDLTRRKSNQTRSAFISSLVERVALDQEWNTLRRIGDQTAKRMKLLSEDDVYRLLKDA